MYVYVEAAQQQEEKKKQQNGGHRANYWGSCEKKKKLSVVHGDFVERRVGALLGCSFNRQRRS